MSSKIKTSIKLQRENNVLYNSIKAADTKAAYEAISNIIGIICEEKEIDPKQIKKFQSYIKTLEGLGPIKI